MVAIEITDGGVEVDALANMDVHPAADLFPLMRGVEFDELVTDIAEHGQRDPIVMTPTGQLLDGRNRWRACAKAGVTPLTRVEESEPWAYVISTNVHRRHLTDSQRAMIATRIAERSNGERRRPASSYDKADPRQLLPPSRTEVADLLNVGVTSIDRATVVRKHGTAELQRAVEQGDVPVYTAARVARSLSAEQQDDYVQRVENGADPTRLATALAVPSGQSAAPKAARTDNRAANRHRHLGVPALRSLRDSLDALDIVLRSTPDGLDLDITSEEAAHWVDDLSKGRGALRRVLNLLNDRKEYSP